MTIDTGCLPFIFSCVLICVHPKFLSHAIGMGIACVVWITSTTAACAASALPRDTPDQVLHLLTECSDKKQPSVVVGQYLAHGNHLPWGRTEWLEKLEAETGQKPVIVGADYAYGNGRADDPDIRAINGTLIELWNQGHLIALSWHARNPVTGGTAFDNSPVNLAELSDPKSALGQTWFKELDRIGAGLAELQKAGVVVIWRPFHEMNGRWFWWGNRDGGDRNGHRRRDFVSLWKNTRRYLQERWGLKNLIWVYCASDGAHSASGKHPERAADYFYPGDAECDMVAIDSYSDPFQITAYGTIKKLGKPMAIAEFGPPEKSEKTLVLPEFLDILMTRYPGILYCHAWDGQYALRRQRGAREFLTDPRTITLEKWMVPVVRVP